MVRAVIDSQTKSFFEVTGLIFSGVAGSTCFGVTRLTFFRGYRGFSLHFGLLCAILAWYNLR